MFNCNDQIGIRVSGLIRDVLNKYINDYEKCLNISIEIDDILKNADFLDLYDGTTFCKSFVPTKKYQGHFIGGL